jgi:hypothetical protein
MTGRVPSRAGLPVGLGKRAESCNGDTSHSLNEMGRGMLRPYKEAGEANFIRK